MAVTAAAPASVNVQVFALFPPLEQAPVQMASRPFETVSVIDVPVANEADPLPPTATLIPAGVEVMFSPLRPVAVTVSAPVCAGGVTVRVAVRVTAPAIAVIVTGVDAVTALVVTAKVALVAPCATEALAGIVAAARRLLESVTANPPAGAAAVKVTVPCEEVPPVTLVGLTDTAESAAAAGGVTVRVAVRVTAPAIAVIVTGVDAVTALVVTAKVALVAPCATETLTGSVAAAVRLLDSVTANPPAGAAAVKVTVPCDDVPPVTVVGLTDTAESAAGVGAAGAACASKRRVAENAPAPPAEFTPRTRHHMRCAGRELVVYWDAVTVALATKGDAMVLELSIWIS